MSRFDYGDAVCPVCNNNSLLSGEHVDFGVGTQKVTADQCDVCGYTEDWRILNTRDYLTLRKCWELQIDFWKRNDGTETETGHSQQASSPWI